MTKRSFTTELDVDLMRWYRVYAMSEGLKIGFVIEQALAEYRAARAVQDLGPTARLPRRRGPVPVFEQIARAERLQAGRKTVGRPTLVESVDERESRRETGMVGATHDRPADPTLPGVRGAATDDAPDDCEESAPGPDVEPYLRFVRLRPPTEVAQRGRGSRRAPRRRFVMTYMTDEELKADSERMIRAGVFLPCVAPDCGYGMIVGAGRFENELGVAVGQPVFFAECVRGRMAHFITGFASLADLKAYVRMSPAERAVADDLRRRQRS